MEVKMRRALAFVLILVDIFLIVAGFMLVNRRRVTGDIGRSAVKLMYDFDNIEEIPQRYMTLSRFLCEEDWERLNIDNDLRAVNTYYKFNALQSEVHILDSEPGCVAYRLLNGNIPAQTVWFFTFDIVDGKICNVREYEMLNMKYGGEGVW